MARAVVVGPVQSVSTEGRRRSAARVDGATVWFESPDTELDPSPEALASAFLLPAVRRRRRLELAGGPVSREWRQNIHRLLPIWQDWWGYPVLEPIVEDRLEDRARAGSAALCFTGGVDSFYSLFCSAPRPDALVFVEGYDIPLDEKVRLDTWNAAMSRVASDTGTRAIRVRTNLRAHPLVARSQWDRAHGGALAAIGHLLTPVAGRLVISSSAPTRYGYAWGSHERTDHLWSSECLHVEHHGASASRIEKVQAIAAEPLVRRHLRVCWENRAAHGNCSECDKCLNTMVTILACGDPGRFTTFDWSIPLEERLARIRITRFVLTYGELLQLSLPAPVSAAIERLLQRTVLPARLRQLWHWWRH